MVITFNELRRIKDKLPSGSSQRIADELGIDVDTVRNYFGWINIKQHRQYTAVLQNFVFMVFSFGLRYKCREFKE